MTTLIDFGLSIHLPNIFYYQYLAERFCENDLLFRILNQLNISCTIEFTNDSKYILSKLNAKNINDIKAMIEYNCRYRSYNKEYIINIEILDDNTVALTLRDYSML